MSLIVRQRASISWVVSALLVGALGCGGLPETASERAQNLHARHVETVARASLQNGELTVPNALTSVKFAVIGDSGRGWAPQHEVAAQMQRYREQFTFNFVLMLGDNIYEGPATARDYEEKFERPYRRLLDDDVKFFAVLGNHDDPRQISYVPFHMQGERYYTFVPPEDVLTRVATRVEFFALDSTNLDAEQLRWLDERLSKSRADWKIVFMHHPLYTSGRYQTVSRVHRWVLEPVLIRHHVDAVFSGHEHLYQRTELQNGIQYFISGAAGSLRPGDGAPASYIARSYDADYHFMLVEIEPDSLHVQAISRTGETIDAARLRRAPSGKAVTAPDTEDRP